VASGRGRGGTRRWREWLRRATHHSAEDDRHLVQADERSRRDDEEAEVRGGPVEVGGSAGSGDSGGPAAQASLDQVLRRAAEAREAVRPDRTG